VPTRDSNRDESSRRLLAYSVERLGSLEITAKHLRTSVAVLETWINGVEHMPNAAILALADLIAGFDKK
jgi:hypothetical protein